MGRLLLFPGVENAQGSGGTRVEHPAVTAVRAVAQKSPSVAAVLQRLALGILTDLHEKRARQADGGDHAA